eukprot:CAMPEP_0172446828 /NCGR_PEP_ID=MMETSP1065-20121228/6315_1 /TAXON_ID=265537 /ORGANISM="Amphiprora paludosa, Strain CCMP125" /LENGTH=280 /DNA_ID=CAMNT_0013198017 /DNA_START=356 /DNA_END=1198 /DNA_ORIENTATION=+
MSFNAHPSITGPTQDEDWKSARNEFVHVVGRTVTRLMKEQGYSRERATSLLLREMSGVSVPDEAELNQVKQRYRLAHQQAARALIVSTAMQKLLQPSTSRNIGSHIDAVKELTTKLEKATFSVTLNDNLSENATSTDIHKMKASEICLPEIPKTKGSSSIPRANNHGPASPTSNKRNKSSATSTTNNKSTKTKPRKRSIDEIGSGNSAPLPKSETTTETRPRADSVTEAVSAKMNQPQAGAEEKTKSTQASNNNVRGKRARGGSSSLDEEATTKRTRSSA